MTIERMEIVINVEKSTIGRLSGTVRATGSQSPTDFDGTMELLAPWRASAPPMRRPNRPDQC